MKKKVNISLDEEIANKLRELAEKEHKPVSQWVTDAVLKADKEQKREENRTK